MRWKRKKKSKPKPQPKTLAGICAAHTEKAFLVPRKAGYSPHGSLFAQWQAAFTRWIPTGEFAKTITSIISFPWQPRNTRSCLMSHCGWGALQGRSPLLEPRSSPGSPRGTRGCLAAPAIPTARFSPPRTEKTHILLVFNTIVLSQSKHHCNTKSLTWTSAR